MKTDLPTQCFQCGRPTELIFREGITPDGWFTCDWCGENIVKVSDVMPSAEPDEERIKRNLGFYDFKPSRK